jgi:hypothetical protein
MRRRAGGDHGEILVAGLLAVDATIEPHAQRHRQFTVEQVRAHAAPKRSTAPRRPASASTAVFTTR